MTNDDFMRHGANAEKTVLRSIDASDPWIDFLPQRYQSARGWTGEEPTLDARFVWTLQTRGGPLVEICLDVVWGMEVTFRAEGGASVLRAYS